MSERSSVRTGHIVVADNTWEVSDSRLLNLDPKTNPLNILNSEDVL